MSKKRNFGPFWEFWELKKTIISLNWLSVLLREPPNLSMCPLPTFRRGLQPTSAPLVYTLALQVHMDVVSCE